MHLVESAKNFMVWSGAEWVLWLLIVASLASLAIILERWLALRAVRAGVDEIRTDLLAALRSGGFAAARERIAQHRHPAVKVLLRGMAGDERTTTAKAAEESMAAEAIAQRRGLERRFNFLATLGANAPFIGLFGTVVGILQAFEALGKAAGPATAGALAPQAVMGSIAEALVATAVGLAVAIPAVFAYNMFQRTVKSAFDDAQMLSLEVLAHLESKEAVEPRRNAAPSSKSPLSLSHAAA